MTATEEAHRRHAPAQVSQTGECSLSISYGTAEEKNVPKRMSSSEASLEVLAQTLHVLLCFGTLAYVREHTEFEGLLPWLMPRSNLKFCMFSITDFHLANPGMK